MIIIARFDRRWKSPSTFCSRTRWRSDKCACCAWSWVARSRRECRLWRASRCRCRSCWAAVWCRSDRLVRSPVWTSGCRRPWPACGVARRRRGRSPRSGSWSPPSRDDRSERTSSAASSARWRSPDRTPSRSRPARCRRASAWARARARSARPARVCDAARTWDNTDRAPGLGDTWLCTRLSYCLSNFAWFRRDKTAVLN